MGDNKETTTATPAVSRHFESAIAITAIRRNQSNPRKHFDQASLLELAASIRLHGILQPVALWRLDTPIAPSKAMKNFEVSAIEAGIQARGSVLPSCDDWQRYLESEHEGRYLVLLGERRWRAAYLADLVDIPAVVYSGLTAEQALEMALVENLQRQDMNAMEEAEGFEALGRLGRTQAQIADRVGKSRARVSNAMRLLDLPDAVKEHVRAGLLTQKHAEGLLRFRKFPEVLVAIADRAVRTSASAAELAKGLPFAADLERAKVVKQLDYADLAPAGLDIDDAKVFKQLKDLDCVLVVKGEDNFHADRIYVLDLEAFEQWLHPRREAFEQRNREAAEAKQREQDKARAKAAGEPAPAEPVAAADDEKPAKGPKLVDLRKLGYDGYKLLADMSAAVRRQIPPERIELGINPFWSANIKQGETVEFTRDIALVNSLERQLSMKENRATRERLDVAFECAIKTVRGIKAITAEDLAQIAEWARPRGFGSDSWTDTAMADLGLSATDELHKLKPLQLVQVIIMTQLRQQYDYARKNAASMPDDLEIYAGDFEKEYKKRKEAEKEEAKKKLAAASETAAKKAQAKSDAKVAKHAAKKSARANKPGKLIKGRRVQMTEELRQCILDAIKEGGTGAAIAKRFGVSLPTVQNIKRAAGLTKTADKAAAK